MSVRHWGHDQQTGCRFSVTAEEEGGGESKNITWQRKKEGEGILVTPFLVSLCLSAPALFLILILIFIILDIAAAAVTSSSSSRFRLLFFPQPLLFSTHFCIVPIVFSPRAPSVFSSTAYRTPLFSSLCPSVFEVTAINTESLTPCNHTDCTVTRHVWETCTKTWRYYFDLCVRYVQEHVHKRTPKPCCMHIITTSSIKAFFLSSVSTAHTP